MEIIRGKIPSAKKCIVYGPEGIGKSTFSSRFPDPVFIDTEGSTKDMDVARTPAPSSWAMLMDQVRYFIGHPDGLKTLIIDTADWAEQLCVADVCSRYQKSGIEDFGYGKGYTYLQEEFGRLLNLLTELVEQKGVNVVLTAHAKMRKFEQPDELGAYDRWEMKLTKQVAPMVKEWADMVLFANYKTIVVNVDGQGAQKGRNKAQGGKRVMYTTHHSCWDAKNRYGLPDEVPFEYEPIRNIIEGGARAARAAQPEKINPPARSDQLDKAPEANSKPPVSALSGEPVQQSMDLSTPDEPARDAQGFMDIPPSPGDDIWKPDPRIPKALRDLMTADHVCEWDIQNVVIAKGHFPDGVEVWEYPQDYIDGVLVGAWPQVYAAVKEMKEKEAIPFN